jgi:heme-degrading monooxygenase HmoA
MFMMINVKVSPNKQEEFLQAMLSLLSDIKEVIASTLHRKDNDENEFILTCEWKTQEDKMEFLQAENFKIMLGAIDVLCEESDIQYSNVPDFQSQSLTA